MKQRYWDNENNDFSCSVLLYTAACLACLYADWWQPLTELHILSALFGVMALINSLTFICGDCKQ